MLNHFKHIIFFLSEGDRVVEKKNSAIRQMLLIINEIQHTICDVI